ncbi:MAG: hypothetical protein J0L69_10770 [Bacteroidetes bacterium]|nr:hypothetical protein [Bacteroidota bacterium]
MDDAKDIAARVERKLNEQTSEFNVLRDRILAVIGFTLALLTLIFSSLEKLSQTINLILAVPILFSLIFLAILIYALITNPISRGMDTVLIKELIEDENKTENDFFLHDISYNLDSFKDNAPKLERLRSRLNWALVIQAFVAIFFGLCTYFNNI